MKYLIKHQADKQLHIKLPFRLLTEQEADILYYGLNEQEDVLSASVFRRTASAVVKFQKGAGPKILETLDKMDLHSQEALEALPGVSARATNEEFKEKIITKTLILMSKWI